MRLPEKALPVFSWLCGLILLTAIGCVIGFLFFKGWRSLHLPLVFGTTPPWDAILLRRRVFDGLFPAMAGTFLLVCLAVGWAVPAGIGAGIYLAEYAGGKTRTFLNLIFDLLAGLPSIVIGLFGFSITVYLNHHLSARIYPCLLISSVALAFLVLPYTIRATQTALESQPASLRMTAPALGAGRLQNIIHVLLPQSLSGIMSGVILATGRCAEDTAVIMLTGAVATAGLPQSVFSGYEALPFYIYYISSQYTGPEELATGYGAAIILLVICLMLFSLAFFIQKKVRHATQGRNDPIPAGARS